MDGPIIGKLRLTIKFKFSEALVRNISMSCLLQCHSKEQSFLLEQHMPV